MSVKADVDRGLEIRLQMEKLAAELKDIQVRLTHAALHGEQVDLTDPDREGRQYLATGTEQIVPVVLTSDMIIGEFGRESARHSEILKAVNHAAITNFFKPVNKFENRFDSGKKFRAQASEVFGDKAPQFITACIARDRDGIPKSSIKVMWDDTSAKGAV